MPVLAVTALPLAAGVLLAGGYIAGEQDALVYLAILAVLHGRPAGCRGAAGPPAGATACCGPPP